MNYTVKRIAIGLTTSSLAVAGLAAGVAMAQGTGMDASSSAAPATTNQATTNQGSSTWGNSGRGGEWHRHEAGRRFLSMFRQLGLSADQKSQIKTILADARAAHQKDAGERQAAREQMAALANPGDPNYATAVQAAKTRAADAIQKRSDLQVSLYNVLTPQQKAQLTQMIEERRAERAATLQERRSGPAATPSGPAATS